MSCGLTLIAIRPYLLTYNLVHKRPVMIRFINTAGKIKEVAIEKSADS